MTMPRAPIVESQAEYATLDDRLVRGFLSRPESSEDAPEILVIHEWWGLNDNIRTH
jgi:carboxymethylenebutenolidase